MGQTYAAIDQSAQSVTTVLGHLDDRTDSIQTSFSGTSFPGTPAEGWVCRRTDLNAWYVYDGASWRAAVLTGEAIVADIEGGFYQANELRVENLAGDEAVASGKDGFVFFHTGTGLLMWQDYTVAAANYTARGVIVGTTDATLQVPFGLLDASNPPTAGTKGTTPTTRGWLFDAANELMSFNIMVPNDYTEGADMTFRLYCVLNQAETNADDIDWSADIVTIADGEVVSGTSTAAAASTTDIGTDSGEGALHACDITIDYDDGTNPPKRGDQMIIEIHRTDLAEVGGVILTGAALIYKTNGLVA